MKYLTTKQLAERWQMSPTTLSDWRVKGWGPKYLKLGLKVRYSTEVVEAWEAKQSISNTAEMAPTADRLNTVLTSS